MIGVEEKPTLQHLFAGLNILGLKDASEVVSPMLQTLADLDSEIKVEAAICEKELLTLSCFQSANHLNNLESRWNCYSNVVAAELSSHPSIEQIPSVFKAGNEYVFSINYQEDSIALLYISTTSKNEQEHVVIKKIGKAVAAYIVQQYEHEKLKEKTQYFEQILNSIPSDLVVFDKHHRYQYINPIAIKDQKVREWLIGRDDFDYVNYRKKNPEIAKQRRAIFNSIIKEKRQHQFEEKAILPDGSYEWKHRTMYPVMAEDGETVEMVLGYALDITEVKQKSNEVKRANTRLNTLISSLNSGIVLVDHDGKIVLTNTAMCKVFNVDKSPSALIGKHCSVLYHKLNEVVEDVYTFTTSTQKKLDEGRESLHEEIRCLDGRVFERDLIPIHTKNEHLGYLWQYRDVTQKKKSEHELRRALEAERSYNELNRNFVSMVSHEFRTPLTSIQTTAELLSNFVERFSSEDIKKRAERIHKSSVRMDTLIQDVLTIGKLDSDSSTFQTVEIDIPVFVRDIIEQLEMSELADRTVITTGLDTSKTLYSDPSLLELILRNLLENAAKYSPKNQPIHLKVNKMEAGFEFICTDFGIGIPVEEQKTIFESFKRASNTEGIKGTGLGLSIVQKSVQRLNGELAVQSEPNKGSTFTVRMPSTK